MNHWTKLERALRARAKHRYGKPVTVRRKGDTLWLGLTNRKTGEHASQRVPLEEEFVAELFRWGGDEVEQAEFVDRLVQRFLFPITPLQPLD